MYGVGMCSRRYTFCEHAREPVGFFAAALIVHPAQTFGDHFIDSIGGSGRFPVELFFYG